MIGNAVKVMQIATSEETEEVEPITRRALLLSSEAEAGKARAAKMTPERRSEIEKRAVGKRWHVVRAIVTGLSFARRPLHEPGKESRFSRAPPDAQVTFAHETRGEK
jgi:hypothetical protein